MILRTTTERFGIVCSETTSGAQRVEAGPGFEVARLESGTSTVCTSLVAKAMS